MRHIIVTGGTGALGRAVVRAFLEAGDRVVVPWIEPRERADAESREAQALSAGKLVLVEADVADEAGATAVAKVAGSCDVLVNGVGGFAGGVPLHETPLAVWDRLFRMNLRSAVAMCHAVLPGMLVQHGGVIVSVASRAALERPAGLSAYSATKDALLALTETLQKEVEPSGIRVHALLPTTIDTPANRAAMPDADFSRWTPPERIARVLLWLASDDASNVRGALLPV